MHEPDIREIAERIARTKISVAGLERVVIEPATDSEGNDALRIILVLRPDAAQMLSGDAALNLLVELQGALREKGEERFPIIEYATETELVPDDPEEPIQPEEEGDAEEGE